MIFLLNRNKKWDDTSPERIPRLRIASTLSVCPKLKIFISMRMYDSRVSSSTEVNTKMIRFYDILVPSLFRVQTSWRGECVRDIDSGGSGVLFPLWCHQRFFHYYFKERCFEILKLEPIIMELINFFNSVRLWKI